MSYLFNLTTCNAYEPFSCGTHPIHIKADMKIHFGPEISFLIPIYNMRCNSKEANVKLKDGIEKIYNRWRTFV